jgi:hypothetical protein
MPMPLRLRVWIFDEHAARMFSSSSLRDSDPTPALGIQTAAVAFLPLSRLLRDLCVPLSSVLFFLSVHLTDCWSQVGGAGRSARRQRRRCGCNTVVAVSRVAHAAAGGQEGERQGAQAEVSLRLPTTPGHGQNGAATRARGTLEGREFACAVTLAHNGPHRSQRLFPLRPQALLPALAVGLAAAASFLSPFAAASQPVEPSGSDIDHLPRAWLVYSGSLYL